MLTAVTVCVRACERSVATPIFVAEAAAVILLEGASLPKGVLTSASAFRNSSLVANLNARGVHFSVVSEGPVVAKQ